MKFSVNLFTFKRTIGEEEYCYKSHGGRVMLLCLILGLLFKYWGYINWPTWLIIVVSIGACLLWDAVTAVLFLSKTNRILKKELRDLEMLSNDLNHKDDLQNNNSSNNNQMNPEIEYISGIKQQANISPEKNINISSINKNSNVSTINKQHVKDTKMLFDLIEQNGSFHKLSDDERTTIAYTIEGLKYMYCDNCRAPEKYKENIELLTRLVNENKAQEFAFKLISLTHPLVVLDMNMSKDDKELVYMLCDIIKVQHQKGMLGDFGIIKKLSSM
jgi:hypothetical protein